MRDSFKRWAADSGVSLSIPFPPSKDPSCLIELANFGYARIDDYLYPLLSQHRWFAQDGGKGRWYAARREREPTGQYRTINLHTEIVRRYVEFAPCRFRWPLPSDVIVEFKNGLGLDCTTENIRLVTKGEHIELLSLRKSHRKG